LGDAFALAFLDVFLVRGQRSQLGLRSLQRLSG
jgi:hypothetical protein